MLKTKNFHRHLSGPPFRDYHLLVDDQSEQILAMSDPIAERVRKLGGTTLRSIGHIGRLQHAPDNDSEGVAAQDMQADLLADNRGLRDSFRKGRARSATSTVKSRIGQSDRKLVDEAEGRIWFLAEIGKG